MSDEQFERLLHRMKLRQVPEDQLSGYTDAVRRRLQAEPPPVSRTMPVWAWWRRWVPLGAGAVLVFAVVTQLADSPTVVPEPLASQEEQLLEEAVILSMVAPEENLFNGDEDALLDEWESLELLLGEELSG